MKFNLIKNNINILLLALCSLNGVVLHAMEREESKKTNRVAPYVNAAASFAVARYVPEIAESVMPHITPNYPLVNALVPSAIKYGAYGLGTHVILKNACGINYADFLKKDYLKKVVKNSSKLAPLALCHPEVTKVASDGFDNLYIKPAMIAAGALTTACLVNPNLAPATLCHPQVAQLAADCCTSLASSYVTEDALKILNTYTAPALMATGALSTLYLVNRNIFNGKLWKKVKRICKDVRPYLFVAPLVSAYNADALKNQVMKYIPLNPGSNLHADVGSVVKATIYGGSLGLAAYLLATESFDLANQGYVRQYINRLIQTCSEISNRLSRLTARISNAQNTATEIRDAQIKQNTALNQFATESAATMKQIAGLLKNIASKQIQSREAVEALERININLSNEAKSIIFIAREIAQKIAILKAEHSRRIEEFKHQTKEHSQAILKLIAEHDTQIAEKFAALEKACGDETTQLDQLQPKLAELLRLLHEEGQTYHIDQQRIENIAQILAGSTVTIEKITKELGEMQARIQTPTGSENQG